jgi:hypothetical protein
MERGEQPSRLLEMRIRDLIDEDIDVVKARLIGERKAVKARIRLMEPRLAMLKRELDGGKEFLREEYEEQARSLERLKMIEDQYAMVLEKLPLINTLRRIGEEVSKDNPGLWEDILDLRLKDFLEYTGDVGDAVSLLNYTLSLLKGEELSLPKIAVVEEAEDAEEAPRVTAPQPKLVQPAGGSVRELSMDEYLRYGINEWRNLIEEALRGDYKVKLPRKYFTHNRSLRLLLKAALEVTPEQFSSILAVRDKYLLGIHSAAYTLFVEKGRLELYPGSSEEQLLTGEGGLLELYGAEYLGDERGEDYRRKKYKIVIDGREYLLIREVLLRDKRAYLIRYYLA